MRRWINAYREWDERLCARLEASRTAAIFALFGFWICLLTSLGVIWHIRTDTFGRLASAGGALVLGVALTELVRRSRRAQEFNQRRRAGLCVCCGYDLRASTIRCPECGAAIG